MKPMSATCRSEGMTRRRAAGPVKGILLAVLLLAPAMTADIMSARQQPGTARENAADAKLAEAESWISKGRGDLAEPLLREAIAHDPSHWRSLCRLGLLLASDGRHAEAEKVLEESAGIHPDAVCLSRLAQVLLVSEKYSRAEQVLRRGLELEPDSEGTLFNLARLLERSERIEEAVPVWERYIGISTDEERRRAAHLRVGRMLEILGRSLDAARHLRHIVRAEPDRHDVRAELAIALTRASQYDEALEEFGRVEAAGAMDARTLSSAGSIHLMRKDLPRAVDYLSRSVTLEPESIPTRIALATALSQSDRDDEAIAHLERVTRDDPENVRAWFLMGQSLRRIGRTEEARRALERHRGIHERIMRVRMGDPDRPDPQ